MFSKTLFQGITRPYKPLISENISKSCKWKAKTLGNLQNTTDNIYFLINSWTKFPLNINRQPSKAPKLNRQPSKLEKINRQPSKLFYSLHKNS